MQLGAVGLQDVEKSAADTVMVPAACFLCGLAQLLNQSPLPQGFAPEDTVLDV